MGGFARASAINNGNGTVTFTIPNRAGAHSFFYHLPFVSDNPFGTGGPIRNIYQTFQWTEKIIQNDKPQTLPININYNGRGSFGGLINTNIYGGFNYLNNFNYIGGNIYNFQFNSVYPRDDNDHNSDYGIDY